ncbi:helix-turn-helix transcriptional regulator [Streptomyces sp. NPDC054766]|uniref:helix-turn-helix transcriptional regulator n=1 Tax=Streptomyces rhizosphaerihabitans TaxID=1266770 RepID=UPI0021C101DA|nr:helix-turn-helix transcriptional regulator [Streptomyces rhizosphaerihabitans]MCT9004174.1 helix-turn-helix transcriptional regulator [Streptomyces rhizosphaerihabitans]
MDGKGGAADASRGSEIRRHELATFLRSRRERITPEQVQLPRGRRRRTPGLRREEVAQLSAVGVTWYTWLEQARDIQVSEQVLDALARTLLLDTSERAHLFQLAGAVDPSPAARCEVITPALRLILTQLEPVPACIQNSRYDILAYNRTYARLMMSDLDTIPPADRNCMILAYTNAEWRESIVFLDETMRLMAARLRVSMAGHLGEPAWKMLLKRLRTESAEFREIWDRYEVVGTRGKTKQFVNPYVGLVTVGHTDLWLAPDLGARMVTYAPADEESRARLERLHAIALEAEAEAEAETASRAEAEAAGAA